MTNRQRSTSHNPTQVGAPGSAGGASPNSHAASAAARSRRRRGRLRITGNALVDGAIVVVLVAALLLFVAYPMLCILERGLWGPDGLTLDHVARVWDRYRTPLFNSVFTGACTALLCTAASVAVALVVTTRRRGWVQKLLMGGLLISMVSPPFVSSLAYIQLYGRRGWITHGLLGLSLDPYNCWGIILMQSLSFVPLSALLLVGILQKIDGDAIRAAQDVGARPAHVLRDIVLRLMGPGILVSLLLTFVRSLADFGTPIIIGGRYSTIASEIYLQIVGYSDLELSAAMNAFLLIPSVAAFFVYRALMRRSDRLTQAGRGKQGKLQLALGKSGPAGLVCWAATLVFYLATTLQYGCIFIAGFLKRRRGTYSFTLDYWNQLWAQDASALLRSVLYALIVALVGTLFAMLFAYYVNRRRVPGRTGLDCLASLPFMLPGPCFGLGYILAFNHSPLKLTGTALIVMANMMFKQLPTTTKICAASLAQVPPALENSVRDLGGGRVAVLRDAVLPQLKPAFLSSFAYNFSTSMTTAGAILFLISPGQQVAVFTLFDAVYTGDYALASLMATLIVAITLIVEGVVFGLARLQDRGSRRSPGTPTVEQRVFVDGAEIAQGTVVLPLEKPSALQTPEEG